MFFFFKQKTAYEMRISDWSSDVCSSDLGALLGGLLEDPDQVLVRVLVELMAPVPSQALRAEVGAVEGGRRVVRQTVELRAGDRPVARAHGLRMRRDDRSEEHTSELQSLMRNSFAVLCLKKQNTQQATT